MSFMKGDLLAKTRKLMKGGIIARPRWFDAVMRVPPEPKKIRCKKAPKIVLPEDRLVESYYARHPEAKFIPFELNSFDPPPARKFAWRQLELMDDGYPRDVARDMVEVEFAEAEKAAEEEFRAERRRAIMEGREPPAPKKSKVEEIQEEEWEYLSLGLAAIGRDGRKAGERPAGSERPPRVWNFSPQTVRVKFGTMEEPLSKPGGSLPSASSVSLLTTREWLQQEISIDVEDFGTASIGRRGRHPLQYVAHWDQLPRLVDEYVEGFENPVPHLPPIGRDDVTDGGITKFFASHFFLIVLGRVIRALGVTLAVNDQVSIPGSRGPDVGVDERVASLAASPTQYADFVVNDGDRQVLVVEMKRPGLFRKNVHVEIPRLHLLVQQGVGGPPTAREEGASRVIMQLFGYMQKLNLRYGILSSFDFIYVAHCQGNFGEILFISDGIDRGSKRFLGVIAFMLHSEIEDPGDFKNKVSKPISSTHALRGLKCRGPQDENKEKEKARSVRRRSEGMMTQNQRHLQETPAELLHLAQHHFATSWSGKIVRGNYEGQSVVVKLAPVGSHRAEALITEVSAYHMLKEFWGKYVPPLVSYGTTVGGTIMYIAMEEFNGYEMGMGPLS